MDIDQSTAQYGKERTGVDDATALSRPDTRVMGMTDDNEPSSGSVVFGKLRSAHGEEPPTAENSRNPNRWPKISEQVTDEPFIGWKVEVGLGQNLAGHDLVGRQEVLEGVSARVFEFIEFFLNHLAELRGKMTPRGDLGIEYVAVSDQDLSVCEIQVIDR